MSMRPRNSKASKKISTDNILRRLMIVLLIAGLMTMMTITMMAMMTISVTSQKVAIQTMINQSRNLVMMK